MNEQEFQLFFQVFNVGAGALYALCLSWFLGAFLKKPGRKQRSLVFAVYLFFWLAGGRFSMLAVMVCLLAGSGFLGMEKRQVFLLTVFYYNVRISGGLMVESLHFIGGKQFPFVSDQAEVLYLHTALSVTVILASHALCMMILLYILKRRVEKMPPVVRGMELCYLTLLPAAGVLFGQIIAALLFEIQDGMLLQLYERHPAFLALVPLLAVLFYLGTYLTVVFWQGTEAIRQERENCFVEYQQTRAMRERMEEVQRLYGGIRRMRHEIRGHLTNIKGLAQQGLYGDMEAYLARIDESMGALDFVLQTGNPVLDVVVNDKRQQAEALGIRFCTDFHYPGSGCYDAFDLGIILGNLLQNALEACGKVEQGRRYISLTGRRRGGFFLVEVRNSAVGTPVFGADGLPLTTKTEETSMHGIGLSNVRREVEKYMGEMDLKMEQGEFCATVLLQERRGEP